MTSSRSVFFASTIGLLALVSSAARAEDISEAMKARQSAYARWVASHPDIEAQIANLKAKTTALVSGPGGAAVDPAVGDQPTIWRVEGAVGEVWDSPESPLMTIVPAGRYTMGSPPTEPGRSKFEGPQHLVTIDHPFAVSKYEVTFDEWDICVASGGCDGYRPDDNGWGRGSHPVINVSWRDVQSYIAWLNQHTGKQYRLPSDAEWEYAARAGTRTPYFWGDEPNREFANFGTDQCCGAFAEGPDKWAYTAPVGSFPANKFGLYDMSGNVMQYVQDCWQPGYERSPVDGSASYDGHCGMHVLRGSSWSAAATFTRSADRIWVTDQSRFNIIGFRVARLL